MSNNLLARAEAVSRVMKLLSHPQRLCMLRYLSDKPRTVTELVELCGLAQPQISQFLNNLREANILEVQREGRFMIYSISDTRVLKVMKLVAELYCHESSAPNAA